MWFEFELISISVDEMLSNAIVDFLANALYLIDAFQITKTAVDHKLLI